MTPTPQPGMYDWVARHTSEVEHEVIAFRGETLELLRVAQACDAGYVALERQLAALTRQRDELLAVLEQMEAELHRHQLYFGEFRGKLRSALSPYWLSNPGVEDNEVLDAALELQESYAELTRQRDALLATLRKIADGQDDPAWMRLKARKAIAEVTQ